MVLNKPNVIIAGVEREMTNEEYEIYLKDQAEHESKKQAELEVQAKRQALLDKLGITADEAKLLLS